MPTGGGPPGAQNFTYALKSINHVFKDTQYKCILAKPFIIDYPEYLGLK